MVALMGCRLGACEGLEVCPCACLRFGLIVAQSRQPKGP